MNFFIKSYHWISHNWEWGAGAAAGNVVYWGLDWKQKTAELVAGCITTFVITSVGILTKYIWSKIHKDKKDDEK